MRPVNIADSTHRWTPLFSPIATGCSNLSGEAAWERSGTAMMSC